MCYRVEAVKENQYKNDAELQGEVGCSKSALGQSKVVFLGTKTR